MIMNSAPQTLLEGSQQGAQRGAQQGARQRVGVQGEAQQREAQQREARQREAQQGVEMQDALFASAELDNGHQVFVPYDESMSPKLTDELLLNGRLVPFQLSYRCVRLLDGTFEFTFE